MKILLIYGAGIFAIAAAATDWNWFFENSKAIFFVKIFGRQGARVFYAALGLLIVALGFYLQISERCAASPCREFIVAVINT